MASSTLFFLYENEFNQYWLAGVTGGVPLDQPAHPVLETVLQTPALVVVIVVLVVRLSVARVVITLSLILSPVT